MEYCIAVDEDDRNPRKVAKTEVMEKNLVRRTAHIIVLDSSGKILLQKRGANKSIYPERFTSSASGHVQWGESYEKGAERELEEETGVKGILEKIGKVKSLSPEIDQYIMAFKTISDGPFTKQESEVKNLEFFTVEEIQKLLERALKNSLQRAVRCSSF